MPLAFRAVAYVLGSLAINWISSQLSFGWGLTVMATWFVVLAYQGVMSDAFVTPTWRQRRFPRMAVYGLAMVIGAGVAAGLVAWSEWRSHGTISHPTESDAILQRTRELTPMLQTLAGKGDKIEYDMRGANPRTKQELAPFAKRIEDWRTDVSQFLVRELPGSGADTKFLMFSPQPGNAVLYEYTRLNAMRANLISILDSLEAYVKRSGVPANKQRAAIRELVALRERGVTDLLNRALTHDGQWPQFSYDVKQWELSVEEALTRAGAPDADITKFRVLGTYSPKQLPGINAVHAQARDILAEKIERLTDTVSRLPQV